jgi:phosphoketolase
MDAPTRNGIRCAKVEMSNNHQKSPDLEHAAIGSQSDTALLAAIENIRHDWPQYGYRRVTAELNHRGIHVNISGSLA